MWEIFAKKSFCDQNCFFRTEISKFSDNFDFWQKFLFWPKISIFDRNFDFFSNFRIFFQKIYYLVSEMKPTQSITPENSKNWRKLFTYFGQKMKFDRNVDFFFEFSIFFRKYIIWFQKWNLRHRLHQKILKIGGNCSPILAKNFIFWPKISFFDQKFQFWTEISIFFFRKYIFWFQKWNQLNAKKWRKLFTKKKLRLAENILHAKILIFTETIFFNTKFF